MSDLHEAATTGNVEQLQLALRRGADVNMPDEYLQNKCAGEDQSFILFFSTIVLTSGHI